VPFAPFLAGLERFHPLVYDRIDTAAFDVTQPLDVLQGALVPTVRKTAVELPSGTFAVALGDVHATLDPLMGQGANVASYAAFVMGEEIVAAKSLGRQFVERMNRKREERVLGAMHWTNLMLVPPSD
jgi:2-polyprenyl-6-methoxyphenol hydroxylase-like FAD-dependent oxidoreductase